MRGLFSSYLKHTKFESTLRLSATHFCLNDGLKSSKSKIKLKFRVAHELLQRTRKINLQSGFLCVVLDLQREPQKYNLNCLNVHCSLFAHC